MPKVKRMEDIFVAILSMLLVVALIPLYLWRRSQVSQSHVEPEEQVQVCFPNYFVLKCSLMPNSLISIIVKNVFSFHSYFCLLKVLALILCTMGNECKVRQRETVVRATGARRMRRRPASAASTSSAPAPVEGSLFNFFCIFHPTFPSLKLWNSRYFGSPLKPSRPTRKRLSSPWNQMLLNWCWTF